MFFRLSEEGLFHLLDNIEGRLHCGQMNVYKDPTIDRTRLNRIIRYAHPVLHQILQFYLSLSLSDSKLNFMIFI